MEKHMLEVKVYTAEDGCICIEQEIPHTDTYPISLNPEQVDIVIKWLQEAKNEILNRQDSDADQNR